MKTEEIRKLDHCIRITTVLMLISVISEEQMQHVLLRAYGGWDRNYIVVVSLVRGTRIK